MFLKMFPEMGDIAVVYATRMREKSKYCEFGINFDERILEHLIQKLKITVRFKCAFQNYGRYKSFFKELKTFPCR